MNIIADLHVHAIQPGDTFQSDIEALSGEAQQKGLIAAALVDRLSWEKGPHGWIYENLKKMPKTVNGVYLLKCIESSIVDSEGNLQIDLQTLMQVDFVIASMHEEALPPGAEEETTKAWLAITENPAVDCLGHLGNPLYPCDYEQVIWSCFNNDKLIEINENSFTNRQGSEDICSFIVDICKDYELKVVVNSAARTIEDVGKVENSLRMLEEIEFPEHLVINADENRLGRYFRQYKNIDIVR